MRLSPPFFATGRNRTTSPAPPCAVIKGNDVLPGLLRLPTVPYENALARTLDCTREELEAWSHHTGRLVHPKTGKYSHGFIAACHAAYSRHHPLSLSPDHLWLLIVQGVAYHVRENAEALRPRFVAHEGKAELLVRRDEFVLGFAGNDWEGVVEEFVERVGAHIGEASLKTLTPNFSTTGTIERVAVGVALMDAFQQYFDYSALTVCGIPSFHLEGTPDDWRLLRDRADALVTEEIGLEWWRPHLLAALDNFVAAAEGRPEPEFWRDFYCVGSCNGDPAVCGEQPIRGNVLTFLPYLEVKRMPPDSHYARIYDEYFTNARPRPNPYLGKKIRRHSAQVPAEWGFSLVYEPDEFHLGEGFTESNLPSGVSLAPFTWQLVNEKYPMEFVAGFVGATQDARTCAVRPALGWAIGRAKSE